MNTILQWNIRSLKQRLISLDTLLEFKTPEVFCLQETKLEDINSKYYNKSYEAYHHINKNKSITAGGISIFVKKKYSTI